MTLLWIIVSAIGLWMSGFICGARFAGWKARASQPSEDE